LGVGDLRVEIHGPREVHEGEVCIVQLVVNFADLEIILILIVAIFAEQKPLKFAL
jgi:hypothetical protein